MLCARKPGNLLAKEIIGSLENFSYAVKHIRLRERRSERYFLIIVCFMSGYRKEIQKDFFVIILVYFRLHLSWISNVRFLGNCEIAIILKQRTKNVEPQFLLIHFRILSAMRGRI